MARAKKTDVEKPKEGATLQIDVDSFVRTRDSVSSSSLLFPSALLLHSCRRAPQYVTLRPCTMQLQRPSAPYYLQHNTIHAYRQPVTQQPSPSFQTPSRTSRRLHATTIGELRVSLASSCTHVQRRVLIVYSAPRLPSTTTTTFAPHALGGIMLRRTTVTNKIAGCHWPRNPSRCHSDPLICIHQAHQRRPR